MSDTYVHHRHAKIDWWVKNYERALRGWTLVYGTMGMFVGVFLGVASSLTYQHASVYFLLGGLAIAIFLFFILEAFFFWWFGYYRIPDETEH